MAPLVSVIIPTYRRWDLLCAALECLRRQTLEGWEAIVVNDAGGEPEGRAVELLRDPRVRLATHDANRGLAAARNTGIALASGSYLAYLDDDDVYYPDHLQTLVGAMERNGWKVAYADAYRATYESQAPGARCLGRKVIYRGPFAPGRLWRSNRIPVLSVVHHRSCLADVGGFDASLPVLEDWDFWLRLSCRHEFHHVPAVTSEFRVWRSRENMTQATSLDRWNRTTLRIYRKCLGDSLVMSDPRLRAGLAGGLSRFVRKNAEWLAGHLDGEPGAAEVLRLVRRADWVRMLLRRPGPARSLRDRMRSRSARRSGPLGELRKRRAFRADFRRFGRLSEAAGPRFPLRWQDRHPCLDDGTAETSFDRHYVFHTAWAARILAATRPATHVDVSSSLYFCSIASAFVPIEFYDYRPAALGLDGLSTGFADLLALPFPDGSVRSLSCMHVVEHVGLGRYGDALDPEGDLKAIRELVRVAAPGADLLLVVPVGRPRIAFNAHRIYSYDQIAGAAPELELREFALIPDRAADGGLVRNASKELADAQRYGCGCFWFRRRPA